MTTLHPASVAVRSLSRSLNTGFLFFVVGIVASPGGNGTNLLSVVGLVAIGIVLGIVYEFAYYRRFRYELTDDTFDVTSGVLARRDRELPLGRVQNVDIRQNVLVRVLGIAAVHIETAGGGQTEVSLQYVDEDEARRLRRQLRDGVSTDASDTDETGTAVRDTDAASAGDETVLFEIRPHELAILSVFTIDPGASLLGGIALSFASGFDPVALVPANRLGGLPGPETGLIAIAWGLLLFVLAAWLISAALTFTRYYGFRLTRVGDELYYERGLLQRYSGTIPLEKIQTLTITESIPFRWFGYAALSVETAGYAPGQSDSRGSESAIPLADADRVAELARAIEPFGPIDLESPPRRARERYAVRYLLVVAAVVGVAFLLARYTGFIRQWYVLASLAVLVPIAAHLKWRNRASASTTDTSSPGRGSGGGRRRSSPTTGCRPSSTRRRSSSADGDSPASPPIPPAPPRYSVEPRPLTTWIRTGASRCRPPSRTGCRSASGRVSTSGRDGDGSGTGSIRRTRSRRPRVTARSD